MSPFSISKTPAASGSWLEKLARLGYASRGVIYIIIGVLALLAAVGGGGQTTDTKGALAKVLEAPFGWVLLLILAIGLLGYAVWRLCQAGFDADNHGSDAKGIAVRAGLLLSGLTHVALAFWTASLALQYGASSGGGSSRESWVAWLMSKPFGQWLVGIVGLTVIGIGVAQFLKGHHKKFEKHLKWNAEQQRKFSWICTLGLYARGLTFSIIGAFVVFAAIKTDPSQAGGLQEALQWLRSQPYGVVLLGAIAIGLAAFGVYSMIQALYRRVNPPDVAP